CTRRLIGRLDYW
nr:immunoglobulin heavy chain junction region [Macaca mulatta]